MKIDRRLNLVQPIQTEKGTIYLHSMPISREVFENHFLVLSKTYAALMSEGLNVVAGPPVAKMMLKHIAVTGRMWEGPGGVEQSLLAEIRRLTSVIMPTEAGWQTIPFDEVIRRDVVDDDALADAEGALVFFTCASGILRGPASQAKMKILMDGVERVWNVQTSSLDVTAFSASLPTLTPGETSTVKRPTSSVPH